MVTKVSKAYQINPESEVQQVMAADVFAKMMNWISAFVAKIVDLFKQLGEILSMG